MGASHLTVLFDSPLLRITDIDCSHPRGGCGGERGDEHTHLMLLRRGGFGYHLRGAEYVGDPATALLYRAGDSYRISHPFEGGDAGSCFEVAPAHEEALFGQRLRGSADAARPEEAIDQYRHRALHAALAHDERDRLRIEEAAATLCTAVLRHDATASIAPLSPAIRRRLRQVQEVLLALWLEPKHTKDQILEMYLNRVYFGSGAYGVEAASRRYFGKSARDVSLSEAALLAGLLKAPSKLSPARDPKAAEERAQLVLAAMRETGKISDKEYKTALSAPATRAPSYWTGSENYVADTVMDELPDLIGDVRGDIVINTTVDLNLQKLAEQSIRRLIDESGKKLVEQMLGEHCAAGGIAVVATHEAIALGAQRLALA